MEMKYTFKEEQQAEIRSARQKNRDKQIDKRLEVLELRSEGKSQQEIVEKTGFHRSHICNLIKRYFEEGITSVSEKHYVGNRRNLSIEEETAFLEPYRQQAEKGQLLNVREIEEAYKKKVRHSIGRGQIYRVLKRHGWRKVMPRSRHPKKASEEVIAASKKLTPESKK